MKAVYWISAMFAYCAVFLESFAFVVLCLIAGFCTDMVTSGAGVATMVLFIIDNFFGADIAPTTAKICALTSSSVFAFLLVGSLYTASRNNQPIKAFLLGFASFAISFLGITKGMFTCFPFDVGWTILDWQNLLFASTISIVPILTYSTSAVIINKKFGGSLINANDKIVTRINTSIDTTVTNMGNIDDIKTEAVTAKETGKAQKKKAQAEKKYGTQKSETTISADNIDSMLESIMNKPNNN